MLRFHCLFERVFERVVCDLDLYTTFYTVENPTAWVAFILELPNWWLMASSIGIWSSCRARSSCTEWESASGTDLITCDLQGGRAPANDRKLSTSHTNVHYMLRAFRNVSGGVHPLRRLSAETSQPYTDSVLLKIDDRILMSKVITVRFFLWCIPKMPTDRILFALEQLTASGVVAERAIRAGHWVHTVCSSWKVKG